MHRLACRLARRYGYVSLAVVNAREGTAYQRGLHDARKPMIVYQDSSGAPLMTMTKDGHLEQHSTTS